MGKKINESCTKVPLYKGGNLAWPSNLRLPHVERLCCNLGATLKTHAKSMKFHSCKKKEHLHALKVHYGIWHVSVKKRVLKKNVRRRREVQQPF